MPGLRAYSAVVPPSTARNPPEAFASSSVEATLRIATPHLERGGAISGVSFASAEMTGAARLAAGCALPRSRARLSDFSGRRGGVQALLSAVERLTADPFCADVIVTAAGPAGAASFLLGRKEPVAEILGTHSSGEGEFLPAMKAAIAGALVNARLQPDEVASFAIGADSEDDALALMSATGVDARALSPFYEGTGAAAPLLALVSALERAKKGDAIVLAAWGDGADAIVLRVA